jgi:hypothetical protein
LLKRGASVKDLRSYLPVIFCAMCAICALGWPLSFINNNLPSDYSVFWAAANMALEHPDLIYNDVAITLRQAGIIDAGGALRPWAYPPTALIPLLPFSMLPYQLSLTAFVLVSGGMFLFAARQLFERRALIAMALIALSQPVIFAALNGQMILLVAAFAIGGLVVLPRSPVIAGVLLGVAAAIKPQLLVFAPLAMLAGRQYRALGAATLAGLAMVLVSLAFGLGRWTEWIAAVGRFRATVETLDILYRNVTPTGILWFWGLTGAGQLVANGLFAIAGAVGVWTIFRGNHPLSIRLVALAGGGLFAAPYAMNYDLALLVPAAVAFIVEADRRSAPLLPALLGGMLLVSGGLWTAPVAVLFALVSVASYAWPSRAEILDQARLLGDASAEPVRHTG